MRNFYKINNIWVKKGFKDRSVLLIWLYVTVVVISLVLTLLVADKVHSIQNGVKTSPKAFERATMRVKNAGPQGLYKLALRQ